MQICFLCKGYPTPEDPYMPFVQQLVVEMSKQGVRCVVLCPQRVTRALVNHVPIRPKHWIDRTDGCEIEVYQPRIFTFSTVTKKLNQWQFRHAFKRVYKKIHAQTDILYAHFWNMGMCAAELDDKPLFIACGESRIKIFQQLPRQLVEKNLKRVSGVIYVGSKSRREAEALGLQRDFPYIIAPNGYHSSVFHPMDQAQCRQKLGWKPEDFVVVFVGSFIRRKGADRLCRALELLREKGIHCKACFIGRGPQLPAYEEVLFCGAVSHGDIAVYLNASDIFVLPTDNEGCCNAIVEALACGLPVVSSNQTFNDDILNEENAIRVDPHSPEEIAHAIEALYRSGELRERLGKGALRSVETLEISRRAEKIIHFIQAHGGDI